MKDKQDTGGIYEVEKPTEQKKAPKKKPNIFLRLLAFLLTLALMVGAVALVVYRDKFSFDAVRRWFTYRTLTKSDSGQAESFSHDGDAKDSFVAVGDNLLICSKAGLKLYSGSGVQYADTQVVLDAPVTNSAGSYALVYNAGGRDLFVYKDKEQVFTLTDLAEKERPSGDLLSARINPSGWLAVTARSSGYKGSIWVYDSHFQGKLALNLSSSFLTDALVSRDNKYLAAITMGQGATSFESTLNLYQLDHLKQGEEPVPDTVCSLGGSVVLDLSESAAGYWALGDSSLTLAGHDGALVNTYDYSSRYLKEYSLGGDDFAALLLGKYRAGTVADLVVVDATGKESATLPINEQIISISASGRYLSVLTADRLDIYTSDLTLYSSLEGTQSARKVLQRSDGTAMLIGSNTARLYIPS